MPIVIYSNWACDLLTKINGFKVNGFSFIPFCIVIRNGVSQSLINHETIHYKQMLECLIMFWYFIYMGHYLINRITMNHKTAYKNICFEKEAYREQNNNNYIKERKLYNWI